MTSRLQRTAESIRIFGGALPLLLRGSLLALGLLAPMNLPFSVPSLEPGKRFGWSVALEHSAEGTVRPTVQQVLRHGYTHGVLAGDHILEIGGAPADSARVAEARELAQVGDTLHLLVERQGRRIELAVPVVETSFSYIAYLWYRVAVAVAGWMVGMALIAWRGQQGAALALGAALILLAPVTASAGAPGHGLLVSLARAGWQIQAAAFTLFMPALLLHFTILQRRPPRLGRGPIWVLFYLALVAGVLLSTDFLREPMAWTRFGAIREFRALAGLLISVAAATMAALTLRRRGEGTTDAARWVSFAILLVTGTNAILYGARLILGEQNVGEIFWRMNGSTLILLPITGALYLLIPGTIRKGAPRYHRHLASTISVVLTLLYGFSVIGVAAVLLSVAGHRLDGDEWLLFGGIFLATVVFSPVLRWSEEVADRLIFARWRELEQSCQAFTERIGLELTPQGIARCMADELPALLGVSHASLALAADEIDSWGIQHGDDIEIVPREELLASLQDDAPPGELRLPIRYPDGNLIGVVLLGGRLEPTSPQAAVLGTIAAGIAAALRNARTFLKLHRAEQELAESERIASLGALAGGLAHEIKNPLAGLKMGLYLLEQDGTDPRKLQRIQRDLRRIDDLVSGLLRFTHDGGREEHAAIELRGFLQECIADLQPFAEDQEIQIHIEQADEELRVHASPSQLRVLLSNLLRNALDAAGHGGAVRVTTTARGAEIEVDIHDSGPGIPAGLEERIFEFTFSTKPGGTGLGLALARREAEHLGGRIEILPAATAGTLLRVVLPRAI